MRNPSTVVLGLDGVPWDLLNEWISNGKLPNLERLVKEGTCGPLQSTVPATTPLAWPSIFTGVNPDKHGIYGFQKLASDYSVRRYDSTDIKCSKIWEMVDSAVVGNVPMTYPPTEFNGVMVSGMLTPSLNHQLTYPKEYASTVRNIDDYRIGLQWGNYRDQEERFVEELETLLAARKELLFNLLEEDWELFFFVFTAPDRIQHLLWDTETLISHYQKIDSIIGDLLKEIEETETNLFVVSDHGFGKLDTLVHVNSVLQQHDFITKQASAGRNMLSRIGMTKSTLKTILDIFNISGDAVIERLPNSLSDSILQTIPGSNINFDIEYSETIAFMQHRYGAVYINDDRFIEGVVETSDVPQVKRQLVELFSNLEYPETGRTVLEIYDGNELYPTDQESPDLVIEPKPGYGLKPHATEAVFSPSVVEQAGHRPEGILIAWGPSINENKRINESNVVDITPTVLHSMDYPVPCESDGKVVKNLFSIDSDAYKRETMYKSYEVSTTTQRLNDKDSGDVEDRLRDLGYIE